MRKLFNKYFIIGLALLFLFAIMIVLLKFNVGVLGENNSKVGLYSLNKKFIPNKTSTTWDDLSDLILYVSILVLFIFVVRGIINLFDTGSIFKVDKEILVLGFAIVILAIFWILFDKIIIINYRPFNEKEGSFPSTHVALVTFMALYSIFYVYRSNDYKAYVIPVSIISALFIILVFIGRFKSGNHFFTDCLGGLVLSTSLFFISFGVIKYFDYKENE